PRRPGRFKSPRRVYDSVENGEYNETNKDTRSIDPCSSEYCHESKEHNNYLLIEKSSGIIP
ncbi:MAG: hypothetical protein Q6370_023565, partial [Candidatus Sigynarchaeota archaeon]